MSLYANKITPADVFITILDHAEQAWRAAEGPQPPLHKNRPSGNEFIDRLAELMSQHKKKTVRFYEEAMGLNAGSMHEFILLYSGMPFKDWHNQYLALAAKELLTETDYDLDEIGRRLGFSGINTFSQWFIRNEKIPPARWRRFAKRRQEREDAELLLKAKKERYHNRQ